MSTLLTVVIEKKDSKINENIKGKHSKKCCTGFKRGFVKSYSSDVARADRVINVSNNCSNPEAQCITGSIKRYVVLHPDNSKY